MKRCTLLSRKITRFDDIESRKLLVNGLKDTFINLPDEKQPSLAPSPSIARRIWPQR